MSHQEKNKEFNFMIGVIYIMTTAVPGLIKIGKTRTENFAERMRFLESNGYYNVAGLKRLFAIEVEDYDDKETLLHEIFDKHQIGQSELFALDQDLAMQLLLSFKGRVVYPADLNQEKGFDQVTYARKKSALFDFHRRGIQDGEEVQFISDPSITATVVSGREVEYGGQVWKLSPLTRKIFEDKGQGNKSGAYQGAQFWMYKGKKLVEWEEV